MVTGGAGFIGSNIVDLLIQKGYSVVVLDNLTKGNKCNINPKAKFVHIDIIDRAVDDIMKHESPEVIIHQAAQAYVDQSMQNPVSDGMVNVMGTLNILESARRHKVRKIIYASSGSVYGEPQTQVIKEDHPINPVSFYATSKWMGEVYVRLFYERFKLDYTILRYANVYGPRQDLSGEGRVIPTFIQHMTKGIPPAIYGDGNQTRDFIYVKDIAQASILAMHKGSQQTLNIGTGVRTTINDMYRQLARIMKFQKQAHYQAEREGDLTHSYIDSSKAKKELGWEPEYSLSAGLNEMVKSMMYD